MRQRGNHSNFDTVGGEAWSCKREKGNHPILGTKWRGVWFQVLIRGERQLLQIYFGYYWSMGKEEG